MKTITEKRKIEASLLAEGREFLLLEAYPAKHDDLPFWMKGDAVQFLVVDGDGYAKRITVGRQAYVIIPKPEGDEREVKFWVDEDQDHDGKY